MQKPLGQIAQPRSVAEALGDLWRPTSDADPVVHLKRFGTQRMHQAYDSQDGRSDRADSAGDRVKPSIEGVQRPCRGDVTGVNTLLHIGCGIPPASWRSPTRFLWRDGTVYA